MRTRLFFGLLLFSIQSFSQFSLNLYAGPSNYYGDLQTKKLTFSQANVVIGAGTTFNLTSKWLIRGDYFYTTLEADDKKGAYPLRNLNFKTRIQELDLVAEYNLFDLEENKLTPYVFAGLGVFRFSPYTTDSAYGRVYLSGLSTEGQGLPQYPDRKPYKKVQLNIPVGGGLKWNVSSNMQFGLEYGLRALFTDYLDDVSTTYVDEDVLLNARGPVAVALSYRGDELGESARTYPADQTFRAGNKRNDFYYFGLARLVIRMDWLNNLTGIGRVNRFDCPPNLLR